MIKHAIGYSAAIMEVFIGMVNDLPIYIRGISVYRSRLGKRAFGLLLPGELVRSSAGLCHQ